MDTAAINTTGIECLVVNPADIPKSQKDTLQKTDPRDARNLGLRLQSGVLHGIHIPDEQQEADRVFFRHRKRIWKDLTRCKNRIKRPRYDALFPGTDKKAKTVKLLSKK